MLRGETETNAHSLRSSSANCFGGAALSSDAGAVALLVLGVVSIIIAVYAWMIL